MFENLNPLARSTAILEIVIMLLVAFILGFILAWIIKKSKKIIEKQVDESAEIELGKLKLAHEELYKEKSSLDELNTQLTTQLEKCKEEQVISTATRDNSDNKKPSVISSDEENAKKLGFQVAKAEGKDDLTKIKGVGPFIEKKLNGLGIYTFEQIGAFTPETIEKVTEAIEFFPGRIERDNWVKQANDLK